ncbi:MAG: 2OG-Fe(II) oxygenase [Alphaproteobacteria bacterium]
MSRPGSFPSETLQFGAAFAALLEQIQGPEMTAAIAEKFAIDLTDRPTMVTVRGQCRARDGQIHTDSGGKLITALVYMNADWEQDGGRLRLLRNAHDIEDYVVEVLPEAGTLLVFRCTENAWHGHKSVEGERRMIQLNWVRDRSYLERERRRHKVSAFFKRFALAS